MKKILFIAILILLPNILWAQVENDSIKNDLKGGAKIESELSKSQNQQQLSDDDIAMPVLKEKEQLRLDIQKKDTIQLNNLDINVYQGPALENKYKPFSFNSHNDPFANDYLYRALYRLTSNLYVSTISERLTIPALLDGRAVSVAIHHSTTDWLSVSGGVVTSKYALSDGWYPNVYNDFGVHGSMTFHLQENLSFTGYGQYMMKGKLGRFGSPMIGGETHYGGTANFKIHSNFEMRVGVERTLTPYTGKWKTRPVISPVIHIK